MKAGIKSLNRNISNHYSIIRTDFIKEKNFQNLSPILNTRFFLKTMCNMSSLQQYKFYKDYCSFLTPDKVLGQLLHPA